MIGSILIALVCLAVYIALRVTLWFKKKSAVKAMPDSMPGEGAAKQQDAVELANRIAALIADTDRAMTQLINAILHQDRFQRLKATWRGLHYLVHRSDSAPDVKLRLLDVSKERLYRDLERWPVDESVNGGQALGKIYDDAYRVEGGEPFGCLIGDYWFDHTPVDQELLREVAALAELWQAPFFAGAAAGLLSIDSWRQVNSVNDISTRFAGLSHGRWRSLRESDSSRFIGLVVPNMLGRPPFVAAPTSAGNYEFCEETTSESDYCWTNSVYALALQWIRAFRKHGWCGAMETVETEASPEFPLLIFPSWEPRVRSGCPLEVALTDRSSVELGNQGLIPLLHHHSTGQPCWFRVPSLRKPTIYESVEATTDSRLGVQMSFILSATRFANYLTLIARDGNGRLRKENEIQERLTRWVESYVCWLDTSAAGSEPSALRPLGEARRIILRLAKTSNYYTVRFMIRPQYLLPEKSFSALLEVRLTEVANPAAA